MPLPKRYDYYQMISRVAIRRSVYFHYSLLTKSCYFMIMVGNLIKNCNHLKFMYWYSLSLSSHNIYYPTKTPDVHSLYTTLTPFLPYMSLNLLITHNNLLYPLYHLSDHVFPSAYLPLFCQLVPCPFTYFYFFLSFTPPPPIYMP